MVGEALQKQHELQLKLLSGRASLWPNHFWEKDIEGRKQNYIWNGKKLLLVIKVIHVLGKIFGKWKMV